MNAIEIKDLCKHYPGFSLENFNLTLPSGCIMGLIGDNGAGKTTVMRLILQAIHRESGTITLLGREGEDINLTKQDIGFVPDTVGLPGHLGLYDIGRIMQNMFTNWDRDLYHELLERFGVPYDKKFKDFSRGTKMKLGIAIALSHHPKLLLLDEATSGLDPVIRDEITDIFIEFTREEDHSILISSHIVSDLEKLCDYIAFMHQGKLLLCEEKDRLYEQYGLLHCSPEQLQALDPDAVRGVKHSAYGEEALVLQGGVPADLTVRPVTLEELFIFMVKERV